MANALTLTVDLTGLDEFRQVLDRLSATNIRLRRVANFDVEAYIAGLNIPAGTAPAVVTVIGNQIRAVVQAIYDLAAPRPDDGIML